MNTKPGSVVSDRDILLKDYEADLQRRLDQLVGSSLGSFGATDKINRFLISEIAQLKLQLTELELASFGHDKWNDADKLRPSIDHVWPSMPFYDAGSQISIGAGIMTFGFHFPEIGSAGSVHRWSGPSTHSGLVALINRTETLYCELSIVGYIDPSVEITRISVDGEKVNFEQTEMKSIRFVIAPLKNSDGPVPTQIAFSVNKTLIVQDVQPGYADQRCVGFCTFGLSLLAHDHAKP